MSVVRTSIFQTGKLLRLAMIPAMLLAAWGMAPTEAQSQLKNDHVSWKLLTPKISGKPGETVNIRVKADIAKGAHLYTTKTYPPELLGPSPTEVTVGEKGLIARKGGIRSSHAPTSVYDQQFEFETEFWTGSVTLTVPVRIAKSAGEGESKGWVNFYFMTCTESMCRPPTDQRFEFTVVVEPEEVKNDVDTAAPPLSEADTGVGTVAGTDSDQGSNASAPIAGGDDEGPATIQEQIEAKKKEGLLSYLLFAMGFGFLALTTPCVFPMIPITISFFTKREHNNRLQAVRDAGIYAIGIICTFTALGAIVAAAYGAAGVNSIATNPFINIFIAAIFVTFALSLFGLFEIQVPSGVLNSLNAKANRGNGITSILLMGFVFSLTSFTCTVPFVGPALTSVQGGDWFWPILGMAAFATAFSVPFFLLAMFPSLLKAMPKSGGWLNAVKVVMGFVEIAAAMKFLSNVDLILDWGILTREVVLSVWIAIAIMTSLYLLGRYRLPHDTPIEKIGVARMLFSMVFLTMGFWFLTGLFGGALGEVDAFLPPQEYPGKGNTSILASIAGAPVRGSSEEDSAAGIRYIEADGLRWIQDDYQAALNESKRTGKPIFADFTGYTCTNCRWMERNVFTRRDVQNLMSQYVLARLYTDRREESNQRNRQMQVDRFQTIDLPFYALFSSEDQIVGQSVFTRDVDRFKNFLKRGLAATSSQVKTDKAADQNVSDDRTPQEMAVR